jgi:hypothetical protein
VAAEVLDGKAASRDPVPCDRSLRFLLVIAACEMSAVDGTFSQLSCKYFEEISFWRVAGPASRRYGGNAREGASRRAWAV